MVLYFTLIASTYLDVDISLLLGMGDGDLEASIETTSTLGGSTTGGGHLVGDALRCRESDTEEGRSQSE